MYGIVNKTVEGLIIEKFGAETWISIKKKADINVESFLSNESYDDSITYSLVQATSETLGINDRIA